MTVATIAGWIDLGFAVFHLLFWWLFDWPKRLQASGRVNAAITQTLNIVLIYVFASYGAALIWALPSTPAAATPILAAGAGFWALRLLVQPVLFPMRHPASIAVTLAFILALAMHLFAAIAAR